MTHPARRAIASALCACLAWLGPGVPGLTLFGRAAAWAEDPPVPDAAQAAEMTGFLQEIGYLQGPEDPLRRMFTGADGRGTPALDLVYRYYSQQTTGAQRAGMPPEDRGLLIENARQLVRQHQEGFIDPIRERLREDPAAATAAGGGALPGASQAVENVRRSYGEILRMHQDQAGGGAGALNLSAELNAFYTGQLSRQQAFDPSRFIRHETADGVVILYNSRGEKMYETNRAGNNILYDGTVARQQRQMRDRPDPSVQNCTRSARVEETGRYDYATFNYQACLREGQMRQMDRSMRVMRAQMAAQILGKQVQNSVYNDDAQLAELERELFGDGSSGGELIRHGFRYGDRIPDWMPVLNRLGEPVPVRDVVDPRFARMREHLLNAQRQMDLYRQAVEGTSGMSQITREGIAALDGYGRLVGRYVQMAQLEAMLIYADMQTMALGWRVRDAPDGSGRVGLQRLPDSPDSEQLRQAVKRVARSQAEEDEYMRQPERLAQRYQRLWVLIRRIQNDLARAAPDASLSEIAPVMAAADEERRLLTAVFTGLTQTPQLLNIAETESQGFWEGALRIGKGIVTLRTPTFGIFDLSETYGWSRDNIGGNLNPSMTRLVYAGVINNASRSWFGGDALGEYRRYSDAAADSYRPGLRSLFDRYRGGDLEGTTRAISLMDPQWNGLAAWQTHHYGPIGQRAADIGIYERSMAVLAKAQDVLNSLMQYHVVSSIWNDLIVWSVALAAAAPVVAAGFKWAGNHRVLTGIKAGQSETQAVARVGFLRQAASEFSLNLARHLERLGPAAGELRWVKRLQPVEAYLVRAANSFLKIGGFALFLSGPLGGVQTMVEHYRKPKESQFRGGWDAFKKGFGYSAQWAVGGSRYGTIPQWWAPLILFGINMPSSAWSGRTGAAVAESIAARGVFGNLAAASRGFLDFLSVRLGWQAPGRLAKAWAEKATLERWHSAPILGRVVGYISTFDHVLKFQVLHMITEYVARHTSFLTSEEEDFALRVKAANLAARHWGEYPLWLLLPMQPASPEDGAKRHDPRFVEAGVRHLIREGGLNMRIQIANANPAESDAPTTFKVPRNVYKPPLWEWLMNLRIRGPKAGEEISIPQKTIERVSRELLAEFSGKSPFELMRIARWEGRPDEKGNVYYRGLLLREETRQWANDMARQEFIRQPEVTRRALAGEPIEGEGIIYGNARREVSEFLVRAHQEGVRVDRGNLRLAEHTLRHERAAEEAPRRAADRFVDLLERAGERAPDGVREVTRLSERMREWSDRQNTEHPDAKKTEMDVIREFEASLPRDLSPQGRELVNSAIELQTAINGEFYFTARRGVYLERAGEDVNGYLRHYRLSPESKPSVEQLVREEVVEGVRRHLDDPANNKLDANALVVRANTAPGEQSFEGAFKAIEQRVASRARDLNLTTADIAVVNGAVNLMRDAVWLRGDPKGRPLRGLRPEQAFVLADSMRALFSHRGGETQRMISEMGTGGGKTVFQYVFLLRIAESIAQRHGKKVILLNINPTLDAQDREYYRTLRLISSRLEFDTFDNFKFRVADARLKGRDITQDYIILMGEADAFGTQAASTIGEGFAKAVAENPALLRAREEQLNLLNLLDRGHRLEHNAFLEIIGNAETQAGRLGDAPQARQIARNLAEVRSAAEGLLRAQLSSEYSPDAATAARRADMAANRHQRQADALRRAGSETLSSLLSELRGAADAVRRGGTPEAIEAVDGILHRIEVARARQRLLDTLAEGRRWLDARQGSPTEALTRHLDEVHRTASELVGGAPASAGSAPLRGAGGGLRGSAVDMSFRRMQSLLDSPALRGTFEAQALRRRWNAEHNRLRGIHEKVDGYALELQALAARYETSGRLDPKARENLAVEVRKATLRMDALLDFLGDVTPSANQLRTLNGKMRDAARNLAYEKGGGETPVLRETVDAGEAALAAGRLRHLAQTQRSLYETTVGRRMADLVTESRAVFESGGMPARGRGELYRLYEEASARTRELGTAERRLTATERLEFARYLASQEIYVNKSALPEGDAAGGQAARGQLRANTQALLREAGVRGRDAFAGRLPSWMQGSASAPRPGWSASARRLLARRADAIERSVSKRYELYEAWRSMYERVGRDLGEYEYNALLEPAKAQETYARTVVETPGRLAETMRAKAEELLAAAERAFAAGSPQLAQARLMVRLLVHKAESVAGFLALLPRGGNPASLAMRRGLLNELLDAKADLRAAKARQEETGGRDSTLERQAREAQDRVRRAEAQLERVENAASREELRGEGAETARGYELAVQRRNAAAEQINRFLREHHGGSTDIAKAPRELLERLQTAEEAVEAAAWRRGMTDILRQMTGAEEFQALKQRRQMLLALRETTQAEVTALRARGAPAEEVARLERRAKEAFEEGQAANVRITDFQAVALRDVARRVDAEGARYERAFGEAGVPGGVNLRMGEAALKALDYTPARAREAAERVFADITREFTPLMRRIVRQDEWLPAELRTDLLSNLGTFLRRSSSWLRERAVDLARSYHVDMGNYAYDSQLGRMVVVRGGVKMPTMVDHVLMGLALKNGVEMPFPIKEKTIVTLSQWVHDLRTLRMFGTTGTFSAELRAYFLRNGFQFAGRGSRGVVPEINVAQTQAQRFESAARKVRLAVGDRSGRSIVFVSLADTREVRSFKRYLLRERIVSERQIVSMFTDVSYLRRLRPEARVDSQTNLEALESGVARVVIVDTRVGGRGLDLKWEAYRNFAVVVMDPHRVSWEEEVQIQGRTSPQRIGLGSTRTITRSIDIATAQRDIGFMRMIMRDPMLRQLLENPPPEVWDLARARGAAHPEWVDAHATLVRRGGADPLTIRYYESITEAVRIRQSGVATQSYIESRVFSPADPAVAGAGEDGR